MQTRSQSPGTALLSAHSAALRSMHCPGQSLLEDDLASGVLLAQQVTRCLYAVAKCHLKWL